MKRRIAPSLVLTLALPLAVSSSAKAGTLHVDDNGGAGVDFTNIQPAINAAHTGDVILVAPGTYGAFTLRQGLSILGPITGTAQINGAIQVLTLPAGRRAIVSRLKAPTVHAEDCQGLVVLDALNVAYPASSTSGVIVTDCVDVRLTGSTVSPTTAIGYDVNQGVSVLRSRMEITRSTIQGANGFNATGSEAGFGASGILCLGGSEVHVSLSSVLGGDGGSVSSCIEPPTCPAGDGAPAIYAGGGEVLLSGVSSNLVQGGDAGHGAYVGGSGSPAYGIEAYGGGTFRSSGVTLLGGAFAGGGIFWSSNVPLQVPNPADPSLAAGAVTAGQPITFTVHGAPGARARLWLGIKGTVQTVAAFEDKLVVPLASYDMGMIPAGGTLDYTIDRVPGAAMLRFGVGQPTDVPFGLTMFAQVHTGNVGADPRLTQSLPFILR